MHLKDKRPKISKLSFPLEYFLHKKMIYAFHCLVQCTYMCLIVLKNSIVSYWLYIFS